MDTNGLNSGSGQECTAKKTTDTASETERKYDSGKYIPGKTDTHEKLEKKVSGGIFWKLLEQFGYQGIQFLVSLILARMMTPAEYGTVSLVLIFITIANTFIQSGFACALIQSPDVSEADYSSVFFVTMAAAAACYILLWIFSSAAAAYYGIPVIKPMIRIMGTVLFPGAVISIQTAMLSRRLMFRTIFYATMAAVIVSGAGAVILALCGAGVWAMAIQQLLYYFTLMPVLFIFTGWHPQPVFDRAGTLELFSFGWKILVSGLIDTVWQNIYGLIIGKRYSQSELGSYSRGEQFPKMISSNLTSALSSVMLPAFSSLQYEETDFRELMSRSVGMSAFLIFPMMAGLAAAAEPLICLLLTEKWISAVPYLQISSLSFALLPLDAVNLQAVNALGRSDLFLKLEIIKKSTGICILFLSFPFGLMPMLCCRVLYEVLCFFINARPNGKLAGCGITAQLRIIIPTALSAAVMGIAVWSLKFTELPFVCLLPLQILTGVVLYTVLSFIFNRKIINFILNNVKSRLQD